MNSDANLFGEPLKKGGQKLSAEDQKKYSAQYGAGWTTLFRWVREGRNKGDPCPLHDATLMPAWWARNKKWKCPIEIERAAAEAARSKTAAFPDERKPSDTPAPSPSQKLNLEDFDPDEGDRLRELKQIQAAKYKQFRDAMAGGLDTSALETKYLRLCETIDKIETRAIERLKKQGIYILRADVEADLAANAEMLRQMQASMERRVLERCSSLTSEQRAEVASAIRAARSSEERTLARLDVLTSEEFQLELAS